MEPFEFIKKKNSFFIFFILLIVVYFGAGCSSQLKKNTADVNSSAVPDTDISTDMTGINGEADYSPYVMEIQHKANFHYENGVKYYNVGDYDNGEKEFEAALDIILEADTSKELHFEFVDLYTDFFHRVEQFKNEHLVPVDDGFKSRIALDIEGDEDIEEPSTESVMESSRLDDGEPQIPIVINRRVNHFIDFLTKTNKERTERALSRGSRYLGMMKRILREEGLPEDLVYLVLIESAFKVNAYSYAHACGLWQFIKSTGRRYKLRIDWWVDERRDPEKSTRAAARYLKDLYNEFGCWYLSLAAYNSGENRIRKAIRRSGSRDIWKIIHQGRLPRQTRNYIPAFIAAVIVGRNPQLFGMNIEMEEPYTYDKVKIKENVDLRVIAECCGVSYKTIKNLNPELRRFYTPRIRTGYNLKIPFGSKDRFCKAYKKIPKNEKITWNRHIVKRGETLWVIARKYGIRVKDLIYANNLDNAHFIRVGKTLLISSVPYAKPPSTSKNVYSVSGASSNKSKYRKIRYRVKKGDTLYTIAIQHNTTITRICRWNRINRRKTLYPGKLLTLYVRDTNRRRKGDKIERVSGPDQANNTRKGKKVAHIVRYGDTLYDIAKKYGVTVYQLKRWNNLKYHKIFPGNMLTIILDSQGTNTKSTFNSEIETTGSGKKITYRVKAGDTLWDIARTYNTRIEKIRSWNKKKNLVIIRPGDNITIYLN